MINIGCLASSNICYCQNMENGAIWRSNKIHPFGTSKTAAQVVSATKRACNMLMCAQFKCSLDSASLRLAHYGCAQEPPWTGYYGVVLASSLCGGFGWVPFGSQYQIKSIWRGRHVCNTSLYLVSCTVPTELTLLWLTTRVALINGCQNGIGSHQGSHIAKGRDLLQRAPPSLIQCQELVT